MKAKGSVELSVFLRIKEEVEFFFNSLGLSVLNVFITHSPY
jgi:hypothetical protein